MRCMPSSRSLAENLRRLALGEPLGRHRAGDVLAVADRLREHAAQSGLRQRGGGAADAAGVLDDRRGAGADALPARRPSPSACLLRPGGGWSGWTASRAELGNPKSSLKPRASVAARCAWQLIRPGKQRLAASVVDLGVGIRPEDRIGRADRRDRVAFDRERHVVLHGIDGHDGRVREDDGPGRCRLRARLSLDAAPIEKQCRGASAGAREQLTAAGAMRF